MWSAVVFGEENARNYVKIFPGDRSKLMRGVIHIECTNDKYFEEGGEKIPETILK